MQAWQMSVSACVQQPAAMGSVEKLLSRRSSAQMLHVIRGDARVEDEAFDVVAAGWVTVDASVVDYWGCSCGAQEHRMESIVCGQ
jgi:hypothetical protein